MSKPTRSLLKAGLRGHASDNVGLGETAVRQPSDDLGDEASYHPSHDSEPMLMSPSATAMSRSGSTPRQTGWLPQSTLPNMRAKPLAPPRQPEHGEPLMEPFRALLGLPDSVRGARRRGACARYHFDGTGR